jgi:uncharacterized protein (TIGR03437 family)
LFDLNNLMLLQLCSSLGALSLRKIVTLRHSVRIFLSPLIFAGALWAADIPATLQISSSAFPPGAMAQIRVSFATPQAVATGSFSMDFDPALFGDIADAQMFSAAGDVVGVAEINGRHLDVRFSSPSAGVGRLPDLPVATVAIPILASAAFGAVANVTVAVGPTPWKDFYGTVYALTVEPGTITVGGDLTIQNVPPNSCNLVPRLERPSSTTQPLTPTTVTVACSGSPGDYSGTITVTAGSQSVVVPVSIHIAPGAYHGLTAPPVIGSIVNAASNTTGALAPGEIITIHGSGVGTRTSAAMTIDTSGGVARNLNGLRVLFDGVPTPLVYTSLFQTNVIVPYEIALKKTTLIQVDLSGSLLKPIAVPIAAVAPALFTINSSGVGRASVLNQDNSVNDPSNPAARGSVIQIYATGEGQTNAAGDHRIGRSQRHKETRASGPRNYRRHRGAGDVRRFSPRVSGRLAPGECRGTAVGANRSRRSAHLERRRMTVASRSNDRDSVALRYPA